MTVYQLIMGALALLTTWALYWLKNQRETLTSLQSQINALELKCVVLQHETKNIQEVLAAFSNKLDDLNDKLTQLLMMRPLLEGVIESVKEIRVVHTRQ